MSLNVAIVLPAFYALITLARSDAANSPQKSTANTVGLAFVVAKAT
jgi:hypothetical protein